MEEKYQEEAVETKWKMKKQSVLCSEKTLNLNNQLCLFFKQLKLCQPNLVNKHA